MKLSLFYVPDHHPGRGRSIAALYDAILREAELADDLGYDTVFVAEHHFHDYGVTPDPAVMLSAIAQRTRRLRLGTAVSVLPFRNPVTLAESYAMLDVLSGGRLTLGLGSGYLAHEYQGFGIDPATKRERFDTALDAIERLFAGERVVMPGAPPGAEGVAINVQPVQAGGIPISIATLAAASAYQVGLQGRALMTVPYAGLNDFADIATVLGDYRRGRTEAAARGLAARVHPALDDMILMFHTHVAATDDDARRQAAAAFDLYVDTRLYAKKAVYADIMNERAVADGRRRDGGRQARRARPPRRASRHGDAQLRRPAVGRRRALDAIDGRAGAAALSSAYAVTPRSRRRSDRAQRDPTATSRG